MRAVALRYALAPACILLAVLLYLTPAGQLLSPTGLFAIAVLFAAWLGGTGPGFVAAVLATFALPPLIAMSYPLLGGFLDLPRFIMFSIAGLAVGWGSSRRRRVEAALRESEKRHELAMNAGDEGFWDWIPAGDKLYLSPRFLDIFAFAPGTTFAGRAAMFDRLAMPPEDRAALRHTIDEHFAGKTARMEKEFRILVDGEVRWIHARGLVTRNSAGEVVRWNGAVRDVTARKRAEEASLQSEARFRALTELSADWYWRQDENLRFTYVSHQVADPASYPSQLVIGKTRWELPGITPLTFTWEEHQAGLAARQPFRDLEYGRVGRDGRSEYVSISGAPIFDEQGNFRGYQGVGRNITERKGAEEALRNSEQRYALAMEAAGDGHTDWDLVSGEFYISPRLLEIVGHPPGASFADRADWVRRFPLHPEDRPKWEAAVTAHFAGRESHFKMELRIVVRGEMRWTAFHFLSTRDAAGKPIRWTGSIGDITERKRAEVELRESEARKSAMFETALDCIVSIDHEGRVVEFNPAAEHAFGYRRADALRKELAELIIPPRLRAQHRQGLARYLTSGEGRVLGRRTEMPAVRADGSEFPVELAVTRIATEGAPLFTAYLRDITERKRFEEALRESERRYELAMAASESGYWDWDVTTDQYVASPRAYEMGGYDPNTWTNRNDFRARVNMYPEDFARWEGAREALFAGTGERLAMEVRYMVRGETRWHSLQAICRRDDTGKVIRWTGSTTDITERKRAEEGLKTMERKLRQAQRLEAMGTLAGGIAHDFNNILGAILGYGEMALRDAPKGSRLARDLDSIMVAGERGRALVDRVLAFSRSAVGERVPVHVERVVREALDLVLAKLPPSVTLHAKLHTGLAAVLGDATQVHQVVANLTSNAVQAMPAGGTLRVGLAVERVEAPRAATIGTLGAGEYVVLTVADTGAGIGPDIIDRIFDPFFTTKEVGTGTGLGLSLVHGIVTELDGAIDVASALRSGSTFTVYLPRSGDAAEPSDEGLSALPRGDGQRVLIVDDEEPLVQIATRTLADLGYVPVGFTSSAAALAAFRADPERFDALITDERMPEMSGSALIQEVRGMRDSLPVVLMSGYLGATESKADEVLQKPLSARDLAASLARVLRL